MSCVQIWHGSAQRECVRQSDRRGSLEGAEQRADERADGVWRTVLARCACAVREQYYLQSSARAACATAFSRFGVRNEWCVNMTHITPHMRSSYNNKLLGSPFNIDNHIRIFDAG